MVSEQQERPNHECTDGYHLWSYMDHHPISRSISRYRRESGLRRMRSLSKSIFRLDAVRRARILAILGFCIKQADGDWGERSGAPLGT